MDDDFDDLVTTAGDDLGDLEELLVDVNAGQVLYALVNVDDDFLDDDGAVSIPWERFTYDPADERLVADVDLTMLENSPQLDVDEVFAEDELWLDAEIANELHRYWDIDRGS